MTDFHKKFTDNPHELANDIHFHTGKDLTGIYGLARRITGLANDYPTGNLDNAHMYDRLLREYYRNCDNLGFTGLQTDPVDAGFTPLTITGFFDTGLNPALETGAPLDIVSGRCFYFNTGGDPSDTAPVGRRPLLHPLTDAEDYVRLFYFGSQDNSVVKPSAQSFTGGNPGTMINFRSTGNIFGRTKTFLHSGDRSKDIQHFRSAPNTNNNADFYNGLPQIFGFATGTGPGSLTASPPPGSGANLRRQTDYGSDVSKGNSFGLLIARIHNGEIIEHMQHDITKLTSGQRTGTSTYLATGFTLPDASDYPFEGYKTIFENNYAMPEDGIYTFVFNQRKSSLAGKKTDGLPKITGWTSRALDKSHFALFQAKVHTALG